MTTSITREELIQNCQTGDILLYNSNTIMGRVIEIMSRSRYSHVAIILRDPTYIREDLKGLYILESGAENIADVVSKKKVIGVQVIPLAYVLDQYENGNGYLYYRKLECSRNDDFVNTMKQIVNKTDGEPYDLNPMDWVKAEFQIQIGDEQKENTFWCSALVSYVYTQLGFLDKKLPWTIIAPRRFSYYENERLSYLNCVVEPEKWIQF